MNLSNSTLANGGPLSVMISCGKLYSVKISSRVLIVALAEHCCVDSLQDWKSAEVVCNQQVLFSCVVKKASSQFLPWSNINFMWNHCFLLLAGCLLLASAA